MVYIVWPSLTFPEHLVYELLKAHLEKEEQWIFLCVCAQSLKSRPTLCDPMDCSPPGSSVHGILQARILGWVAISSSRGSPQPRGWTRVSWGSSLAGGFFTTDLPREPQIFWYEGCFNNEKFYSYPVLLPFQTQWYMLTLIHCCCLSCEILSAF